MEEEEDESSIQKETVSTYLSRSAFKSSSAFSSTKRIATSLDETVQDSKMSHLTTTQSIDLESSSSINKDLKDADQFMTTSTSRKFAEKSFSSKTSTFSRSGTSSSSQDDCEPELKALAQKSINSGQYLTTARVETARSMESLRSAKDSSPARASSSASTERLVKIHRSSFLTASERDVRETRIGPNAPARRALSGEDMALVRAQEERELRISAERRRGLFASTERRTPQQLSLPPPERRLTILSPHSPMATPELLSFSPPNSLRGRRKKGMVLPKLVLPRSDSDGTDFFFDRCLIE